jgi:hypothetical protein
MLREDDANGNHVAMIFKGRYEHHGKRTEGILKEPVFTILVLR